MDGLLRFLKFRRGMTLAKTFKNINKNAYKPELDKELKSMEDGLDGHPPKYLSNSSEDISEDKNDEIQENTTGDLNSNEQSSADYIESQIESELEDKQSALYNKIKTEYLSSGRNFKRINW